MHLPEIDKYAHLKSFFHCWDPRLKIISLLGLILSITFISYIPFALIGLGLSLLLLFISRIPFLFVLKHLRWVLLSVSFFLLIMPLTVAGNEIAKFYFLKVSYEGIRCASLISIKAIASILLIFPMIGTMNFSTTIKALERLRVPNRLVQIIMFAYRYIFLFIDETKRMTFAIESRGFKKKTNLHTLKTIARLLGMLFIKSYERTERIHRAMLSRGYDGNLKTLDEFRVCVKDILKASVMGVLIIGFWLLKL